MSNLLSDTDVAFRTLQSDRRNLIIQVLSAQRTISAQIRKLEMELDRNIHILRELADDVDTFDASLDKKGSMDLTESDVSHNIRLEGTTTLP